MNKETQIVFQPPTFVEYEAPNGYLVHHNACHALFYYYLAARRNYEYNVKDPVVLEGDPDQEVNFKQLFTSIALAYGVEPDQMLRFWANVNLQCGVLDLPELPEKYMFKHTPEIRTQ